jgi:hypothetical protein
MLRVGLKLGSLVAVTLAILTLILGIRMSHELNERLPEGQKFGLLSGCGMEASRLHHQFFPNSHLSFAMRASQITAAVLALSSWVISVLIL